MERRHRLALGRSLQPDLRGRERRLFGPAELDLRHRRFRQRRRATARRSRSPADLEEWRELNLRWFQFGAFAPLFRSHGEFPFREIFNLAPQGSEVYDSLVWHDKLRYRLLPYTYTVAADTYHRDGTIMRGLPMDFADDLAARDVRDEYLFGKAFLVAPVYKHKARTAPVYLPAGADWYDFHTGAQHAGGQSVDAAAPLARMPLYVRAGSIVPVGPEIQYTAEKPGAPITLFVFTGADGSFDLLRRRRRELWLREGRVRAHSAALRRGQGHADHRRARRQSIRACPRSARSRCAGSRRGASRRRIWMPPPTPPWNTRAPKY